MPGCCGGNPVEGDKLHGVTAEELVNNKAKRDSFSDKVFRAYDSNKNGVLEKREMQSAAVHVMNAFKGTHNSSLSDKDFKRIWKETDSNHDGTVDKGEFRRYMKRVIDQTLAKATKKGKASKTKGGKASGGKAAKGKGKKKVASDDEDEDADDDAASDDEEDDTEDEEQEETESASWVSEQEESEEEDDAESGSESGSDDEGGDELQQFINHHNKLRKQHGCSPLKHDPKLSKSALEWAKQMAKDEKMYHSNAAVNGVGENLFAGKGKDFTPKEATQAWYDEIGKYDFDNPGFSTETGHFTALIWAEVEKIGYAKFKSKQGTVFIVGHYSPQPNMLGEFEENVPPPK